MARNEEALRSICAEIRERGGRAEYVAADVAQTTGKAPDPASADSLYQPKRDGAERSPRHPVHSARRTSLLLEAQLHPMAALAAVAGLGALACGALTTRQAGRLGRAALRGFG